MINSIFMPLVLMSFLVAYKRFTRNKKKFRAPPTHQLPSQCRDKPFYETTYKLEDREEKAIKIIKQMPD